MEELNTKLLAKDSTVIAHVISKLVEHIDQEREKAVLELSFLKIKCVSTDIKLNEAAAEGIIKLIENEIISPNSLLEEFITLIPNNKINHGIVKVIAGILYHQFAIKNKENHSRKFDMTQHPFITLLKSDNKCLPYLYNEIRFACKSKGTCSLWHVLNYPFYQYCMCNPNNKEPTLYKLKLWSNLLETSDDSALITSMISWMLFDTAGSILTTAEQIIELSQFCYRSNTRINQQILLLLQTSILYGLVSSNYDPRDILHAIEQNLRMFPRVDCVNPVLLILVKVITTGSSVYILEILLICEYLIQQPNVDLLVLEAIKVSLLHWIGNPSNLTADVVCKASEIYTLVQSCMKKNRRSNKKHSEVFKKYEHFIISNQEMYIAFKLSDLCELWRQPESIYEFLKRLKKSEATLIQRVIHLVFAIFVSDLSSQDTVLASFEVICIYADAFKEYSHLILTLILFKLSHSKSSEIHCRLLKYIPKLGCVDENYVKVITTIKVLFNSSYNSLKTLGMTLMFDLWKTNNKVYPYLEEILTSAAQNNLSDPWEFYVNKAYIIKQLCELNAEIHGKEMVAHLSRILNECSEEEGALASSICLDTIAVLCKEGIIEIETTWATLAPKFMEDKRIPVIQSLCGLVAVMPRVLHTEKHAELQKEVIDRMWAYVFSDQDIEIKRAALSALKEFGLECISPFFPEELLDKSCNATGTLEPSIVPGHCWINLMKNQSNYLSCVGDFLIKLMSLEIDEYLRGIYHVTTKKEPLNYSYLPLHSLVRGVADYCKRMVLKNDHQDPVFVECLRILSQEYSKPLPPYNWSFLQELFHEPNLLEYCVSIASHQVVISGTARRLMENYIYGLTKSKNEWGAMLVYKNLTFLANSIQPMILGPFFKETVNYGGKVLQEEHNADFLNSIVNSFKNVLKDPNAQEVTKKAIVFVLDDKLRLLNSSDQMFGILLECVVDYPADLVKLNNPENLTKDNLERELKLRHVLVSRPTENLKWLNDLIDHEAMIELMEPCLKNFFHIFGQPIHLTGRVQWIDDLLGRIEAALADPCQKSKLILCLNILILALVQFSGFDILLSGKFDFYECFMMLPQSSVQLMKSKEWNKNCAKALECFYFVNQNTKGILPNRYQNIFGLTLQALRHHPEFTKNSKWMKYLSAEINFKNNL